MDFRSEYRQKRPGSYPGWLHLGGITVVGLVAIVLAISQLQHVQLLELASAPLFFLVANGVEYLGHRGPMHHRFRGLGRVFERHTQQHHRFFTKEAMTGEGPGDFQITLFPPILLLFFFGGFGLPLFLLFRTWISLNESYVFASVAVAYFLIYEWMHLCYHAHPQSFLARLPGMGFFRRHHQIHHDLRKMRHCNFNITFPIFDWMVGTLDSSD